MTKHRITAHKGGRTARAPEARIRPQTLERIHATMREQGKSWADLVEETYGTQGDERMADEELIGVKQHQHNGKHYTAAYSRQAYSQDKLVAWQGDRRKPKQEWCIQPLETEREFFERVESELV